MRKTVTVDTDNSGQRIDVFLSVTQPELSRSYWQKIIKQGCVRLNGAVVGVDSKISAGEVSIDFAEPIKVAVDIPVIYQDENVIVLNKPSGILTHSKGGISNEFTVADFIAPISTDLESNRKGIVHRLDRATSGLIICALNTESKKFLQKQFSSRSVVKKYTAIVEGNIKEESYDINWPIERNPKKPQTFRVGSNGKPSRTIVNVIKANKDYTVTELSLLTGRTHQIRVHMSNLGHPVIGDSLYGSRIDLNGRILLHAGFLELFIAKGLKKNFIAPYPEDMKKYL